MGAGYPPLFLYKELLWAEARREKNLPLTLKRLFGRNRGSGFFFLSDRNENSKLFFSWSCDPLEFSWMESSLWRDPGSGQLPDYLPRIKRISSPWQLLDPELAPALEAYLEFHEQLQLAHPTYPWKSPPSTSAATLPFCVLSALTLLRCLCLRTS